MRRAWPAAIPIALVAAISCAPPEREEESPAPKHGVAGIQPKEICFAPPLLRGGIERPILDHPADAGRCVANSFEQIMRPARDFGRDTLPLRLEVASDGRVVDVEYVDPCTGFRFSVDRETDACIRRALAEWRFVPDTDTCPVESYSHDVQGITLAPPVTTHPTRQASRGCGTAVGT